MCCVVWCLIATVLMCDVFSSCTSIFVLVLCSFFFFQAEDGIRDLVRSRGLGDVYKRQGRAPSIFFWIMRATPRLSQAPDELGASSTAFWRKISACLLYTSDAADERSSVDLGGRRIIKKKKNTPNHRSGVTQMAQ